LAVATVRPRCDGLGVLFSSDAKCCAPVLSLPEIKAVKSKECASTDNQIGVEMTNGETKLASFVVAIDLLYSKFASTERAANCILAY
jgi:hypothetical protein